MDGTTLRAPRRPTVSLNSGIPSILRRCHWWPAAARLRLVNRRYRAANDQVTACCAGPLEDRPFRAAVLDAISPAMAFDAYVWVLTDPVSSVGVSPLAYL